MTSRAPSRARTAGPTRVAAAVATGLLAAAAAAAGAGVRATDGGLAAVDEPQYLLTALSLATDGGLDIADELAAGRADAFHAAPLPVQAELQPDGSRVSPHDPLLPLVLAAPMAWWGVAGAKAAMAVMAGLLAAMTTSLATGALRVRVRTALLVVGASAVTAPLAVYGQQVYPELPAALTVTVAAAALTSRPRVASAALLVAAVVALPWLSVKYVPVAAVLAGIGLVRCWRAGRRGLAVAATAVLAVCGVAFLIAHRLLYGGWTAYASGDHFQASGELGVVGFSPDFAGRSVRLIGLLVDRDFGLAAWAPFWLLVVPAAAWVLRRRPAGWLVLLAPLAVGWLTATFVALTMHGFWWPGRQVVVVLPLTVLLLALWLDRLHGRGRTAATAAFTALTAASLAVYVWLLVEGHSGRLTWVGAPDREVPAALAAWRALLPDYREPSAETWALHAGWVAVAAVAAALAWRAGRPPAVTGPDLPAPDRAPVAAGTR